MTEPAPTGPTGRFRFTVERHREWDDDGKAEPLPDAGWRVYLPHQCQTWDIAGEDSGGDLHGIAIGEMEAFVAEAQLALDALRDGRELRDEEAF